MYQRVWGRVWSVYQRGRGGCGVCTRGVGEGVECVPEGVGEGVECVPGQRVMTWVNSLHA